VRKVQVLFIEQYKTVACLNRESVIRNKYFQHTKNIFLKVQGL